jgi:hypothetical protein
MRQLIAGNWRMHGRVAQLPEIGAICRASAQPTVDMLICPPSTLIARAVGTAAGRIAIGGQDCAIAETGPCTGDVSAEMPRTRVRRPSSSGIRSVAITMARQIRSSWPRPGRPPNKAC